MMRACPRTPRRPCPTAPPVPAWHLYVAIAIGAAAGGYLRVGLLARCPGRGRPRAGPG